MAGRFRTEIGEQPLAMRGVLAAYAREPAPLAVTAGLVAGAIRTGKLVFTGMGSSYFAGYAATCYLWQQGVEAFCVEAGELLHYGCDAIKPADVVVMVSQSGNTVEIVGLLDAMAGRARVVGVTNEPHSALGTRADLALPIHAGPEEMSSSKTYTNTLLVLLELVRQACRREDQQWAADLRRLHRLAETLVEEWDTRANELADLVGDAILLDLVGRGPSYATAMQSAVILKEGAHLVTEALTGASFRHGQIEIAGPDHAAVIFAPQGPGFDPSLAVAGDLARLGSRVCVLTDGDPGDLPGDVLVGRIPQTNEYLFAVLSAIPLELLIVSIAERRGLEPGALTVGNKVTLKE